MTDYITEQEQIEILKRWIKQYSLVILAGILLSVLIMSGWRYWQERQVKMLTKASMLYDEMLLNTMQNTAENGEKQAKSLLKKYPKTVYSEMAAFTSAKEAVHKKNYVEALAKLDWILDKSDISALRQIARLREARIMIADNHADKAIQLLEKIEDKTFNGLTNEVRGDAYLALKNTAKAKEAYATALKDLPNAEVIRPLLQMKYDNLTNMNNSK